MKMNMQSLEGRLGNAAKDAAAGCAGMEREIKTRLTGRRGLGWGIG